jgi:hypothetical protein
LLEGTFAKFPGTNNDANVLAEGRGITVIFFDILFEQP